MVSEVIKSKEEARFDDIYERFRGLVWKACISNAHGDPDLAEDAFQQTFMELAIKGDQIKELAGWLFKVVVRETRRLVRIKERERNRRPVAREQEMGKLTTVSPENSLGPGIKESIRQKILELPLKYQEVLILHYILGKRSEGQVALILGGIFEGFGDLPSKEFFQRVRDRIVREYLVPNKAFALRAKPDGHG